MDFICTKVATCSKGVKVPFAATGHKIFNIKLTCFSKKINVSFTIWNKNVPFIKYFCVLFYFAGDLSDKTKRATEQCSIPCEPIKISQCLSQSYSKTGFPNFFEQLNQTFSGGAVDIAHNIDLAVMANCSENSRKFLCELLLPECRENEGLVLPKRETCMKFFMGCTDMLVQTTNEELILNCNIFPADPQPVCYTQSTIGSLNG